MFELIFSALALIVLFFLVSYVLVKLYEHGIRSWFIQTILVVFGVFHFISRPSGYVYSNSTLWIFWTIALACMVVIDHPSGDYTHSSSNAKSDTLVKQEDNKNSSSFSHSFLNFLLFYSIFSYFDDDDW